MKPPKPITLLFALSVLVIGNIIGCTDSKTNSSSPQVTLVLETPIAAVEIPAVTIEIIPLDDTATPTIIATKIPPSADDPLDPVFAYLHQPLTGETLRFLDSYITTSTFDDDDTAWTYDNALALLAFVTRGKDRDLAAARKIADAIIYAQNHDPKFHDGRLRDSYHANTFILDDGTVNVDRGGSATGNMAWAVLALVRAWHQFGDDAYLTTAQRLGQWIFDQAYDER